MLPVLPDSKASRFTLLYMGMPKQSADDAQGGYRALHRSSTNRVIAGVAGGLGEYFDIDPTIIRIIFILLTIFGGSGILIYLVLWLIMPSEGATSLPNDHIRKSVFEIRETVRSFAHDLRTGESTNERKMWFGVIILVIGLLFLFNNFGVFGFYTLDRFWPLVVIIVGLLLLYRK